MVFAQLGAVDSRRAAVRSVFHGGQNVEEKRDSAPFKAFEIPLTNRHALRVAARIV